jgi:hypothetical protein
VRCVVVTNEYTASQDFSEAELVVDGFGDPGEPRVLAGDPALLEGGAVTAGTLARVVEAGGVTPPDGPHRPVPPR